MDDRAAILKKHKNLQSEHQKKHMRASFTIKLSSLRDKRSPKFSQYLSCLAFFELLGMYVKNGYIPLRDVLQVYKGPVLELDIAWRDFINTWQQQAHMPPGLFEHALFLMDMVSMRTERPVFFWTIYRFRRFW